MTTENWELQNKPKNVSRRAKALLPEDLGQLVSALLRDSKRSKPLPGDAFEQIASTYKNANLSHPAYAGELDKYMAILTAQVTRLLQKNNNPIGIKGGDFPEPNTDFDIIQRAQNMATLRYVSKRLSRSSDVIEVPNAPWRTVYDAKSGLLCTMEKKGKQKPEVCYAFLPDIVLPQSAQFSEIADTTIYIMPITQKGVKKMAYISSSSAHEIGVSEIEEHHDVISFRTWGNTPRVVMPNPDKPGKYIHEEGALEGVFGGDIVIIKTQNSLVVRDTSGVFRCEVPNNFTPTIEQDGIKLAHSIDTTANVWSKDNSTEPLAKLNYNTGFLRFSDFREILEKNK